MFSKQLHFLNVIWLKMLLQDCCLFIHLCDNNLHLVCFLVLLYERNIREVNVNKKVTLNRVMHFSFKGQFSSPLDFYI